MEEGGLSQGTLRPLETGKGKDQVPESLRKERSPADNPDFSPARRISDLRPTSRRAWEGCWKVEMRQETEMAGP